MTSLSPEALQAIGLVFFAGLIIFIVVAWRARPESWKISTFFLAGRNIGAPTTKHVYWGTSFSLVNGLFYFSVLGYHYGLAAIWFQIPWIAGIGILAWHLPQVMKETNRFTIHGFLGDLYGEKIRTLASWVTLTGFLGFFAFEINVSLEILGGLVGFSELVIPLTILFAVYSAAYCDIGGFAGTAKTDKFQNYSGVIAVLLVGSFILVSPHPQLPIDNLGVPRLAESLIDFSSIPWVTIFGVGCFALFYNFVDMSNWQTIAASSEVGEKEIRKLRWSMGFSALLMLAFPATIGTFLGYVWQGVEVGDYERLFLLIEQVFPNASYIGGLLLGLVVLGLAAIAMSTSDSYLMVSAQTVSWDIEDKKLLEQYERSDNIPEEEQYEVVRKSRTRLYIMAVISVVLFLVLRHFLGDEMVIPFQFVLAGLVVSLAPATLFGLYCRKKDYSPTGWVKKLPGFSIIAGYLGGTGVFLWFLFLSMPKEFDIYAWAPIASLSLSSIVCLLALLGMPKRKIEQSVEGEQPNER
uniref:Na+/proline symporter n=1 Tax=Candidatus Kentrum sp. UNK TaxID=2126344 RepID=A0A451AZB2_9GAMM|nr:MAG: Na+/proline symporter [Candidatus Kentron sp. UNK]VFK71399.1 MAG: Na+/proline symporter [Candidatus Kentron sp. UNK]